MDSRSHGGDSTDHPGPTGPEGSAEIWAKGPVLWTGSRLDNSWDSRTRGKEITEEEGIMGHEGIQESG